MENSFNYCERLKALRLERGFTQEEIALQAEITTSYYGQIERGTANPSVGMLERICSVMEIQLSDIFTCSDTNILGIDTTLMQILHQLSNKTAEEKTLVLSLVKTIFKLKNSSSSSSKSKTEKMSKNI